MHLVHLGGFIVQTPTNDDGDALLHCGADNALKAAISKVLNSKLVCKIFVLKLWFFTDIMSVIVYKW